MRFIASFRPGLHARNFSEKASVCRAGKVRKGTTSAKISPGGLREIANNRFCGIAPAIFGCHPGEVDIRRSATFPLAFELAGSEVLAAFGGEEPAVSLPPITKINYVEGIFASRIVQDRILRVFGATESDEWFTACFVFPF